jgi:hypothetical protein
MLPGSTGYQKMGGTGGEGSRLFFPQNFCRFAYNVARPCGKTMSDNGGRISYYAFLSVSACRRPYRHFGFPAAVRNHLSDIFNILRESIPASTEVLESNIRSVVELRGTLGDRHRGMLFGAARISAIESRLFNRAWDLWPPPDLHSKTAGAIDDTGPWAYHNPGLGLSLTFPF